MTCSGYLERQTKYRQQIFVASWTRTHLAQDDFFLSWRGRSGCYGIPALLDLCALVT